MFQLNLTWCPRDTWDSKLDTPHSSTEPRNCVQICRLGKLLRAGLLCLDQDGIWIWLDPPFQHPGIIFPGGRPSSVTSWYDKDWILHSPFLKKKPNGYTTPICQSISTDRDLCMTLVGHVNQDNPTKSRAFCISEWISSAPANADILTLQ